MPEDRKGRVGTRGRVLLLVGVLVATFGATVTGASALTLTSVRQVASTYNYNGAVNGHLLARVTSFKRTTITDTGGSPIVVAAARVHANYTGKMAQVEVLATGALQIAITKVPSTWKGCTGGRWNGYCLVNANAQVRSPGSACWPELMTMPSGEVFYTTYRSTRCFQTYQFNSDPLPPHVANSRITLMWHEAYGKRTRLSKQ